MLLKRAETNLPKKDVQRKKETLWVLACWQSRFREVRQLYSKLFRFWNSSITSQSGLGLPKLVCAGLKPEGQRNSVLGSPDMYRHEKKNPGKIYDLLNIQNECSTARSVFDFHRYISFIFAGEDAELLQMRIDDFCRCLHNLRFQNIPKLQIAAWLNQLLGSLRHENQDRQGSSELWKAPRCFRRSLTILVALKPGQSPTKSQALEYVF